MKKFLPALLAAGAVAVSPAAFAEGWYADIGYTHSSADSDLGDIDLGAISARGGYDITENFAVELEGALGVADEDILGANVELNYLIGAFGKAQVPVSDRVDLFARAGVVNGEIEASGGGFSASDSETGFGIGVGGTMDLANNFYLRGDYTRYDIEDYEADAFTIGVGMKF
ncbi:MAG: porin family protein [Alphaproteobacteria bacterium]|nr:porin family protein [Alphaproteobacteria bacterium]